MPCSTAASGSQTATLATDHTLTTTTSPTGGAVYLLRVDVRNLANGERLTLSITTKARSGDTAGLLYSMTIAHAQSELLKDSPAIPVPAGVDIVAVLRQENGTGRAFPWALFRLDG